MPGQLVQIITSNEPSVRNRSLDAYCRTASLEQLIGECAELDAFRRRSQNLYERVRALFFLYAIHRFHLPDKLWAASPRVRPGFGLIPFKGYEHLLQRRFEEAIECFLAVQKSEGPSEGISSALAAAYQRLGFQTLADQVRRCVRSVRGNQWMFRMGHPADHPLRVRPELLQKAPDGTYPILRERTPVRMDLSHSGWSDIFFLGMDFPEGARVLNVSIDLGVFGRDKAPRPPVEAYLRVIDEPVLRLTSVDLGCTADITSLAEVFDFARDYLGLLKAAVIAAGIVPPGIEGSGHELSELLARVVGPGLGLEIVSNVNDIPKGSRLAVSTTLLASLISVCMRATGQARSLTGQLAEDERRLVLARALLGEWLSGSGGGWQDSGGLWPGMKLITGVIAVEGDPEYGVSRGRLMPSHRILDHSEVSAQTRQQLQDCLVLVHGGMAQNVGPILEMVTEKYLLRSEAEWQARLEMMGIFDDLVATLRAGDIRRIGELTTRNFFGPIQTIIPWANNFYTETLIERVRAAFGEHFWGFWMLGGMSGGGMGFIFAPGQKATAQVRLLELMQRTKRELERALPFAMDPVVYDFAINERGTWCDLLSGPDAFMPQNYYALHVPNLVRADKHAISPARRAELDKFGAACRTRVELAGMVQALFDRLLPRLKTEETQQQSLAELLEQNGFDRIQHEQIRQDLRAGRIGLAQNRFPPSTDIRDVEPSDVIDATGALPDEYAALGRDALARGELAIVTLAAGVGSRWTQGAGVVKALHPFCKLAGRHRTFIEVHLAKSKRISRMVGRPLPHVITTSYLTHGAIEEFLARYANYGYPGPLLLSPGRAIGLRLIPMVRDLQFMWEEMPQQMLDAQQQKVRDSLRRALISWARAMGEGTDYTDNVPTQCLHPVGHWFEIPNMLRNGVLLRLMEANPRLKYLMMHNIDTLGADADPAIFGLHIARGTCLSFEVVPRRVEDRGGGLARVNGRVRLVEGLAMPREEQEFALSYYNTNTCWIDIDKLLGVFGLARQDLTNQEKVTAAVRAVAARMPTYITIKDVKETLGPRPRRRFPSRAVRKAVGGHDRASRGHDELFRCAEATRAAAQRPGATGRLAPRRLSSLRGEIV
ncbi:MAG: UTP--glucose-1-phosphate uridylyltransferase [Verrucomicrobiales bacterium]|nr:UTP--glucose-1-phosphate uridylyltransferase [Verrucomicrobiales bacterium]